MLVVFLGEIAGQAKGGNHDLYEVLLDVGNEKRTPERKPIRIWH